MAADDAGLVIRHVRLCECGKPAGHHGICRPPRTAAGFTPDDVDPIEAERVEEYARRAEARDARRQPGFRAERHAGRAAMSTRQLQALADTRAALLSPVSAGNIAPSHGAAGHPSVNLALQAARVDLGSDPRWAAAADRERRAVLHQHELLDEFEGLGPAAAEKDLTPEEKDALIVSVETAHLTAAAFAREHPGFGSPSTVARKRRWFAAGYCTFNGLPPRESCRCPTCRRLVG